MLKVGQVWGLGSFQGQHSVRIISEVSGRTEEAIRWVAHTTKRYCRSCLVRFFEPRSRVPTWSPSLLQPTSNSCCGNPACPQYSGGRRTRSLLGDSSPSCSCPASPNTNPTRRLPRLPLTRTPTTVIPARRAPRSLGIKKVLWKIITEDCLSKLRNKWSFL